MDFSLMSSPLLVALCLFSALHGAFGGSFKLVNRCPYTIWPAIETFSSGKQVLDGGGFELRSGQTRTIANVPNTNWSGRLWGRTGCNSAGACTTGRCTNGAGIACNGASYTPPVTLAEFTLGGYMGQTFYDVSAVEGFNLPLTITPNSKASSNPKDYACGSPTCSANVNGQCPSNLRYVVNGQVVGCKSACRVYYEDRYCCSGPFYGQRQNCGPDQYSKFFKNLCPTSYSYPFDDATSTFACSVVDYTITFCPIQLSSDQDQVALS